MEDKNQHYYSKYPDTQVQIFTISESLRRHLFVFKTITGVFSYKKIDLGTKTLIENMVIPHEAGTFLDLGCGYGVIGIVLSYISPRSLVYFIDINKRAMWCTRENINLNLINSKKNAITLSGNYFEPIQGKNIIFDEIYMNPPLRQGRKDFLKVVEEVQKFLKINGSFQFVIRKKMGAPYISEYLRDNYPNNHVEIICKRSGYWVFRVFRQK
ncbi:MAG: class I SAM-dependent methyltransferase [Promethearchaeota archaeon]|jgi:16S rRNA G1207 methylase RsmC